jgi:hypothetical protein
MCFGSRQRKLYVVDDLRCPVGLVGSWTRVRSCAERLHSSAAAHRDCGSADPSDSGAANSLACVPHFAAGRSVQWHPSFDSRRDQRQQRACLNSGLSDCSGLCFLSVRLISC